MSGCEAPRRRLRHLILLSALMLGGPGVSHAESVPDPHVEPASGALPGWSDEVEPFLLGGVQVREPDLDAWVAELDHAGMNTVAVTVYARQGRWDSDDLTFNLEEPGIVEEIRAAKQGGMRVVLILRVYLDHALPENRYFWHGMIMPEGDEEIRGWFRNYGAFVEHWARIAQREGVDVFGLGSELKALTATLPITRWGSFKNYHVYMLYQRMLRSRARGFLDELQEQRPWLLGWDRESPLGDYFNDVFAEHKSWARKAYLRKGARTWRRINARRALIRDEWSALIADVRELYGGKLTYAANFDNYQNVALWKELDFIGINAYFPLRKLKHEESDALRKQRFYGTWDWVLGDIDRFRREQKLPDKPVIFTELGYTHKQHSTVEPWAYAGFSVLKRPRKELVLWSHLPPDRTERRLSVEALREAWAARGRDVLAGLLYWKLSTVAEHEAVEPFVLHVGRDSDDPLQRELARFLESASPGRAGAPGGSSADEVASSSPGRE